MANTKKRHGPGRFKRINAVKGMKVSDPKVKPWTCTQCGTNSRLKTCPFCQTPKP